MISYLQLLCSSNLLGFDFLSCERFFWKARVSNQMSGLGPFRLDILYCLSRTLHAMKSADKRESDHLWAPERLFSLDPEF